VVFKKKGFAQTPFPWSALLEERDLSEMGRDKRLFFLFLNKTKGFSFVLIFKD
jgi:hypothetical protein